MTFPTQELFYLFYKQASIHAKGYHGWTEIIWSASTKQRAHDILYLCAFAEYTIYMWWYFCHYIKADGVKWVLKDWALSFWISITCTWIPHTSQSQHFFLIMCSHAKLLCRGKQQLGKSFTFITHWYGRLSVLFLSAVSPHIYITTTKPHTQDPGNAHTFCLVVNSLLSLELMVCSRSVCWRVIGWISDPESISNTPSHTLLLQADSCKLQFSVQHRNSSNGLEN